jgi:hypothetical protein
MGDVKSTNLGYTGVLMVAFGVIGLFQAASAILIGTPMRFVPLFVAANALETAVGIGLIAGKRWIGFGIATNLLLLLARVLAMSSEAFGVLELGFWVFLVVLAFGLFREGRKGEAAEEEIQKK